MESALKGPKPGGQFPDQLEWWKKGYGQAGKELSCLACGAVVSASGQHPRGVEYWQAHDQWHEWVEREHAACREDRRNS